MTLNRLFICVLIAGVLALIVFSRWTYRCPPPGELMDAWEQIANDYLYNCEGQNPLIFFVRESGDLK